ncbi:hypothetical protein N9C35_03135 [Flavobacteriaceae bacterium]|nr:hypothetical protein [Flavobacteriaceae bacterium]
MKNNKDYFESVHTNTVSNNYTIKYEDLIKKSKKDFELCCDNFRQNILTNDSLNKFFLSISEVANNFAKNDKSLNNASEKLAIKCDDNKYKKVCNKFNLMANSYNTSYDQKFEILKDKYTNLLKKNYLPFAGKNPPNEISAIRGLGKVGDLINNGTIFESGDGYVYRKYPESNNISNTEITQNLATYKGIK